MNADLTIDQRDVLADLMDSAVAPNLISAVHARDAAAVEELLSGLERQDLWALAVVLAASVEAAP